ncbi:AAA family ATPase [Candidatus Roizmanbacteria bacterium CG_4_10_14_0_2_um_filter_39_13]|uniref:AAA family ATPase n=1 Tax=Candidatus Roizmanbacteria bacterium CG_4_10_14_0_2_um_filter_39_13 TaxID=1974825 RepID=A0A2M7U173_9BACT|nr:MAG: AAA family ATPase [Candidatus Roizmanbacteria bacterium CG_4_10_14_0_2_um_filter_39_13]
MDTPLADRLRPSTLREYVGQEHLLGIGKPIRSMIENKKISSMILWGPPGCGKTTIAHLIAQSVEAIFIPFSAVTSGVKEVRQVIADADQRKEFFKQDTILFIDEIHRFNKSQQDAFLPAVEKGTITLIGATTENPGFEINAPLISRSHVYVLKQLSDKDMEKILKNAIKQFPENKFEKNALSHVVTYANGDARSAINAVELAASIAKRVNLEVAEEALQQKSLYYDKKGDSHYDTISAFIKSMRGSNPDATLHYLSRMIKSGEDPMFIARRMVIFASEDVSNAQPTALVVATSTMQAVHMVGVPEAQIILAQCATYLATAKKSIASYSGLMAAMHDLEIMKLDTIPLHLRNASNKVMEKEGYGKDHIRYPWQEEKKGKKIVQEYLPENLKGKKYYKKDWE